jgi:hypothetical protein
MQTLNVFFFTVMSILVNKKTDFTKRFYDEKSFYWEQESISVQRKNENKRINLVVSLGCGQYIFFF